MNGGLPLQPLVKFKSHLYYEEKDPVGKGSKQLEPSNTSKVSIILSTEEKDPVGKGGKQLEPSNTSKVSIILSTEEKDPVGKGSKQLEPSNTSKVSIILSTEEKDPVGKGGKQLEPSNTSKVSIILSTEEKDPVGKGSKQLEPSNTSKVSIETYVFLLPCPARIPGQDSLQSSSISSCFGCLLPPNRTCLLSCLMSYIHFILIIMPDVVHPLHSWSSFCLRTSHFPHLLHPISFVHPQNVVHMTATWGQDYKEILEHVSVLNSQSVLRNDVTSYALARWVWDVLSRVLLFLYSLGLWLASLSVLIFLSSSFRPLFLLLTVFVIFCGRNTGIFLFGLISIKYDSVLLSSW